VFERRATANEIVEILSLQRENSKTGTILIDIVKSFDPLPFETCRSTSYTFVFQGNEGTFAEH
jgi:hypothetical protein